MSDREKLIREVIWYTAQERAERDVADSEMVESWLLICRLAKRLARRRIARRKAVRK